MRTTIGQGRHGEGRDDPVRRDPDGEVDPSKHGNADEHGRASQSIRRIQFPLSGGDCFLGPQSDFATVVL